MNLTIIKRRIKHRFRKVENNYFIRDICTIFIQYTFYNHEHDNHLSQNAQYPDSFFVVNRFIVLSICNRIDCIFIFVAHDFTRNRIKPANIL